VRGTAGARKLRQGVDPSASSNRESDRKGVSLATRCRAGGGRTCRGNCFVPRVHAVARHRHEAHERIGAARDRARLAGVGDSRAETRPRGCTGARVSSRRKRAAVSDRPERAPQIPRQYRPRGAEQRDRGGADCPRVNPRSRDERPWIDRCIHPERVGASRASQVMRACVSSSSTDG
jgi:hypothetical protein